MAPAAAATAAISSTHLQQRAGSLNPKKADSLVLKERTRSEPWRKESMKE
jgi:hypothetical protein